MNYRRSDSDDDIHAPIEQTEHHEPVVLKIDGVFKLVIAIKVLYICRYWNRHFMAMELLSFGISILWTPIHWIAKIVKSLQLDDDVCVNHHINFIQLLSFSETNWC